MNPDLLEQIIQAYQLIGVHASERADREYAFRRMAHYIGQRSPERIVQMEQAKGLA